MLTCGNILRTYPLLSTRLYGPNSLLICLPVKADIAVVRAMTAVSKRSATICNRQQVVTGTLPTTITDTLIEIFPTGGPGAALGSSSLHRYQVHGAQIRVLVQGVMLYIDGITPARF